MSSGLEKACLQPASVRPAGLTPFGTTAKTQRAESIARPATAAKAKRQPKDSPIQAESGKPKTEANDQPTKIKVMSRPRCSGGDMKPIAAAACGVKTAAPSMVAARIGQSAA